MGGEVTRYRDIVILANSRRHDGRCIAGKDLATGEWIRPISIFGKGRKDPEAFYDSDLNKLIGDPDGPKLLDCVKIGLSSACRTNCQPENYSIDGTPWQKRSQFLLYKLPTLADLGDCCFLGNHDRYGDRIPVSEVQANPLKSSLNLIKMNGKENHVYLIHQKKSDGTYKHRMHFTYEEIFYNLSVTDSHYENVYHATKIDDSIVFDDFFMVVGVGSDKFKPELSQIHYHFRFIVGIIPSKNIKEYSL
jgi:hypothetical protein